MIESQSQSRSGVPEFSRSTLPHASGVVQQLSSVIENLKAKELESHPVMREFYGRLDFGRIDQLTNLILPKQHFRALVPGPTGYPERSKLQPKGWIDRHYHPVYHVDRHVIENDLCQKPNGWAHPEDHTLCVPEQSLLGAVARDRMGRLLNPVGPTGIEGRGILGHWGPNFVSDVIMTRVNPDSGQLEVLLVRRRDSQLYAIVGGYANLGESLLDAAKRELFEETSVVSDLNEMQIVYAGYLDSNRNTDHAWIESICGHLHLPFEQTLCWDPQPQAGEDVDLAFWLPLTPEVISNLSFGSASMIERAMRKLV